MKNRWFLMVLAVLLLGTGGCGKKSGSEPAAAPVTEGVLTVGVLDGNDSYACLKDGIPAGIEIYLAQRMAAEHELKIEIKVADTEDALWNLLNRREADVILGRIADGFEGQENYRLSVSYGAGGYYLITPAGNYADTLAGFQGESVGLTKAVAGRLRAEIPLFGTVSPVAVEELGLGVQELKNERLSALICTERQALSLLDDQELQLREIRNSPREAYHGVFLAEQEALASSFDQTVNDWLDDVAAGLTEPGKETFETASGREGE